MVSREKKSPEYKSAVTLSTVLQIMLYLNIGASFIQVVGNLVSQLCVFLNNPNSKFSTGECGFIEWIQILSAAPAVLLFYTTSIVFVCWLTRIRKNALTLGVEQMRSHSFETWLGFVNYVPILYLPPRILQELWKASTTETMDNLAWKDTQESKAVKIWWTLLLYWAVSHEIVSGWEANLKARDEAIGSYFFVYLFSSFCECLYVAAAIYAVIIVRDLTKRQIARHKILESHFSISAESSPA